MDCLSVDFYEFRDIVGGSFQMPNINIWSPFDNQQY
jgi:hypothetical protein